MSEINVRISVFLQSILDECNLIFQLNERVPVDRNLGKTIEDTMLFRSIAVSEQRIGEAASQIMKLSNGKVVELYPAIPWHEIRGLRNHFVHDYLSFDESIIINTALDDIPSLYPLIKKFLDDLNGGGCDIGKLIL